MQWTTQQKINMRSLLEGWEERARVRQKRKALRRMARGVAAHPKKLKGLMTEKEYLDNFHSRLCRDDVSGCLNWTSRYQGDRYGKMMIASKAIRAHRLAWMINNGPIPSGLEICHHCDNPKCCNIEHLFLGTHKENMMDAARKNRWPAHKTKPLSLFKESTP